MSRRANNIGWIAMVLLLNVGHTACSPRESGGDESAPAPMDTVTGGTVPAPGPDTSVATPPINPDPSKTTVDTPPAGAKPSNQGGAGGARLSRQDYEGWRQYSVHCARCHGQDVLPNPVAANLLVSLGSGGPVDTPEKFSEIVSTGRPAKGMPAFKGVLTPDQINAIYAYVKGRADKRIPAGRPQQSES